MKMGTWKKDVHCHLLGKCKSIWQYDITSLLGEWYIKKRSETTTVGSNKEKKVPLFTVSENVSYVTFSKENGM